MSVLGVIFTVGCAIVAGILVTVAVVGIALDIAMSRKMRRQRMVQQGVRILVKPRVIKDAGLRQRLLAHRSIIAASKAQAVAHKQKHDYKVERRTQALVEWDAQFKDAQPALEPVRVRGYSQGGHIAVPARYHEEEHRRIYATQGDMLQLARSLKKQLDETQRQAESLREKNRLLREEIRRFGE